MNFNWAATEYREIVNDCLGYREKRRPRGVVKQLAEKLRCHPTFIAQVLKGSAELSLEQGYELCAHYAFSADERELFLTLLQRDRAGTAELKRYFNARLDRLREEKLDLKSKLKSGRPKLGAFEIEYFGNWLYQAVHAYTQTPGAQTSSAIAKAMGWSADEITKILEKLEAAGLVTRNRSVWRSTLNSLHLPRESGYIRSLHATWKSKLLSDLQTRVAIVGTRYSGLIVVSEKDYQKVREILVDALARIRQIVEASSPEKVFALSMDCYEL